MNQAKLFPETKSQVHYPLDPIKLPPESWRPAEVGSMGENRLAVEFEIDRIPAWIRTAQKREWQQVKIWDYSTLGFEILCKGKIFSEFSASIGDQVELKLAWPVKNAYRVDAASGFKLSYILENSHSGDKSLKLGLIRLGIDDSAPGDEGQSVLPDGYLFDSIRPVPVSVFNAFLYKEWAEACLIGIGPGASLVFESSDPLLLLFAEVPIQVEMELPLKKTGIFTGKLLWQRISKPGKMIFALNGSDISYELANAIGEHFVALEICRPSQLALFGLRLKNFKDQIRFRYAATEAEYQAILKLRRTAYIQAGKLRPDAKPDLIAAEYDARSRLLTAYHGETLIGSAAISFGGVNGAPLRSRGCFPNGIYPVEIPPSNSIIELSALCTHSDYRGGDLIQGLFEQSVRCLLLSDRTWFLTFASKSLWPLYQRIGFQKTGASMVLKELGNLEHFLILGHRDTFIAGMGVSPFDWNYFFGSVVRDLLRRKYLRVGFQLKVRVAFYSLFAGFTQRRIKLKMENEFKEFLKTSSPAKEKIC